MAFRETLDYVYEEQLQIIKEDSFEAQEQTTYETSKIRKKIGSL